MTTSGAPGSSSSIRVRGQATINANAEPLYVIDGVIVQSAGGSSGHQLGLGDALGNGDVTSVSPLSTINPSDIVSMEILKDASATAIYGAQGANGVVLITTKRGKAGEAKFTYDGMVAWQRQNERLDIMNLREYAEYFNDFVADGQANQTLIFQILHCSEKVQTGRMQSSAPHSSISIRSVYREVLKKYSIIFPDHSWIRKEQSSALIFRAIHSV